MQRSFLDPVTIRHIKRSIGRNLTDQEIDEILSSLDQESEDQKLRFWTTINGKLTEFLIEILLFPFDASPAASDLTLAYEYAKNLQTKIIR